MTTRELRDFHKAVCSCWHWKPSDNLHNWQLIPFTATLTAGNTNKTSAQVLNLGIIFHTGTAGSLFFLFCLPFCISVKASKSLLSASASVPKTKHRPRSVRGAVPMVTTCLTKTSLKNEQAHHDTNNNNSSAILCIFHRSVWTLSHCSVL